MSNADKADKGEHEENLPTTYKLPGTVKSAIEQFLRFGDETKEVSHNGYYSGGGWPYDVLKKFIEEENTNDKKIKS